MPSVISSEHSKNDAKTLHDNLGCHDYLVPIDHNPFVQNIIRDLKLDNPKPIADENIQARLRGLILMYFSNAFNALLLSTGNKTELALGYCTIYGDMAGGFCPINDLYKMQVYEMAKFYNSDARSDKKLNLIPNNILTKAPSAELAPGQTDEASLLPYPILDAIVEAYVEHFIGDFKSFQNYCFGAQHWAAGENSVLAKFAGSNLHHDACEYNRMIRLININEFKRRQAAPGIKITPVAFGVGRRLPIVQG
jgi:NAD+ synthase (glutamine-hydrolysing)